MGVISLDLQQTDAGGGIEEEIRRLEQAIDAEEDARISGDADVSQAVADEREARQGADTEIWQEINTIEAGSDVVDVVGTYQDLVNYDTSKLHANDLIKVLQDITHGNAITYYRWDGTSYNYVGAEGPYYTTSETDALLNAKQNNIIAGNNISIAADGKTISAVDTTYTAGTNISISPQNVISATFASYSAGYGLTLDQNNIFAVDLSLVPIISDIPTKTSDLTNDGSDGTSTYVENDDLATALAAKQDTLVAGTNIQIAADGKTISATDTTYSDFTGATSSTAGAHGLVPAPASGDQDKYLKADGTWATVQSGRTTTVFYYNGVSKFCKDAALTIDATGEDFRAALESSTVYMKFSDTSLAFGNKYVEVTSYSIYGTYTYFQGINKSPSNAAMTIYGEYRTLSDTNPHLNWFSLQQQLTAGTNISISNNTISATDTTYSPFDGATSSVSGTQGLVPAPASGDEDKYLKGDGTWGAVTSGSTMSVYYTNQYFFDSTANNFSIYTDSSMTDAVTGDDLFSAFRDGPVQIVVDVNFGDPDHFYFQLVSCTPDGDDVGTDYRFTAVGMNVMIDGNFKEIAVYEFEGQNNLTTFTSQSMFVPQATIAAGTNVTIDADGRTINATDTTYSAFTGATSSTAGSAGLVPAPASGDQEKVLHGDGTWKNTTAKLVEMSYGESSAWAKFIAAYQAGSIVYCRASSNANPGTGSQTRKAFMAYVNNATNPTSVEFQYVRSNSSKSDSNQCDQVFVYTLTSASGGTWSVATRDMAPKILVDSTLNKTFSGGANASVTLGAKAMTGATSGAAGTAGIVPKPNSGDQSKFLRGDGTWATPSAPNESYSSTEINTNTTWIDGSTIYKKTFTIADASGSVAHSISNLQAIVKVEGSVIYIEGIPVPGRQDVYMETYPVPYSTNSNSGLKIWCSADTTNVYVNSSGWDPEMLGTPMAYITIYYTKAASEGSGGASD